MTENEINQYDIILKLKELNSELLQCTTFEEVDRCRYQLLSFIEKTDSLKNIYQNIITQEDTLKRDCEFNTCINRIHSLIIILLNLHTQYRTFTLSRQKILRLNHLETVSFIENNEITYQFVECPNLIYYPSLTIFLPPTNYLNLMKDNKPITYLSDLYSLLDITESLQPAVLIMTVKYNFEYYILNKNFFNIGIQENNFNAAYLRCIVYSVNESLQTHLQNNKTDTIAKINNSNISIPQVDTQKVKCPLNDEQIKILTLRKKLSPDNKYPQMLKHLPGIKLSNLKNIARYINTKLGAANIDESLRLFEEQYFRLN